VKGEMAARVRALLYDSLSVVPTQGQERFIERFSRFAEDSDGGIFVLRGYAGTGKTTMMSAVSNAFTNIVLLAPTGRAAKVLSGYTGRPAYTIHKHLYVPAMSSDGRMWLRPIENKYKKTLFIVDEASMIPDAAIDDSGSAFPGVNLLSDLVSYVYSGPGCRLMLVGDTAQLPPVHFDHSPALDVNHLRYRFKREVYETELTEVVRQQHDSGILSNATQIRTNINEEIPEISLSINGFTDIHRVSGVDLIDLMHDVYREYGQENVLVITRSNKSAIQYNRLIRFHQLWMEDELGAGDSLMVVKNNYHWLNAEHKAGFIANGDVISIQKIHRFEEKLGFRFALATVEMIDFPDEPAYEAYLIMDTLSSEAPAMTKTQQQALFDNLHEHYSIDEPDKRRRNALIRKDPYYNALQVKFAYAVTCHKSQGGQWPVVFVDQGYLPDDQEGIEQLRWLYTAITRASKQLYLLNFNEKYFLEDNDL
jgi:exodeoxyribonuclease-5